MAEIRKFIVPSNPLGRTYNKQQIDNKIAAVSVVVDGVTITGSGTVGDPLVGAPSYTDEQAQDAVGNAVGNGLDYDDATGAISVDLTETTAVVTDPATQARNTIQPTADVTGLTVKKYYNVARSIDPSTLDSVVRVAHYIADDYVVTPFSWADASGNGYNLTAGGGGASKVLNVVNGHAVVRGTNNNHSFRNLAGFTLAQPFVIMMVAKSTYAGSSSPGSCWVANGSGSTSGVIANYYESANGSPGWTTYGGSTWTPTDPYGTVGRFQVVVAKYDGASSYIRSGGNTNTVGNTGTTSMTGITITNAANNLAGCGGDIAEVIVLNNPDDETIIGIEEWLAIKYNLSLETASQQDDLVEYQSGTGETLLKINKEGTIIPTLFGAGKSALDIGSFADTYPRWKFMPNRISIGDGTYASDGGVDTGYLKGWTLSSPGTSSGTISLSSRSNYITDNAFQIRPPGNGCFSINTGLLRMTLDTYPGSHIMGVTADRVGLDVRAFAGQTVNIMNWTNSSGTKLSCIKRNGAVQFLSTEIVGEATSVLTGTINPTASTSVVGVGTLFTTQLVVGDRITVSGETRTVTAITDALNLTVDTAFSDNANDTTPDKLGAILVLKTSAGAVKAVMNDLGNIGIGTAVPTSALHVVGGLNLNVTTVTDTYQILATDYTVVCNKATAFTVTLPVAVVGATFNIKNIGAGTVTVDGTSTDTIDDVLTQDVAQWENLTVQCYVANKWAIL